MKAIFKDKSYTHFDYRTHYQDFENYVKDSEWVGHHGFYPFVHSALDRGKFSKSKGRVPKTRHIYYASHIDSYIYQYYGKILNDSYNQYAVKTGIQSNAIAYRNCWGAKNNIDFAREVFEFIAKQEMAYVFVTDLTQFFDSLDHSYLKGQIKKVLGLNALDSGHYAVFKSLTKYAYVDRDKLEEIATEKGGSLKSMDRFLDMQEFHDRKKELIKKNHESFGIPQGTSVSAVYANIYMIDFDKAMAEFVAARNGLYRRYCDDIIVVIPITLENTRKDFENIRDFIYGICAEVPKVEINKDKTEQYLYACRHFAYVDDSNFDDTESKKLRLSYLGFDFDGVEVQIRDKSVFKFYYRAYRKIEKVNQLRGVDVHKYIAGKKAVYNGYTHLYSKRHVKNKRQAHGNFYTYAKRAHEEFLKSETIKSAIRRQIRRHWKKIEKRMK